LEAVIYKYLQVRPRKVINFLFNIRSEIISTGKPSACDVSIMACFTVLCLECNWWNGKISFGKGLIGSGLLAKL